MVPFQLPTLPWCDAATFTPNARCADLHRKPTFKKESNQGLFPVSMTDFVLIKNKLISYPGFPLLVLFGIAGSKAGGMITVLASFTLQQWLRKRRSSMITWSKTKLTWPGIVRLYLGVFAFSAAHATKLAAAAAPVLLVLVGRSLRRLKTKRMERLTAHLAKQHLQNRGMTKSVFISTAHTVSSTFHEFIKNCYLMLTFTGTKVANVGWHERGRGQYA